MALVGIVDDVHGAAVRKFLVAGMSHQLEQGCGVVHRAKIVVVERGCVRAALEPEIGIAVGVEAVEAPASLQRRGVAGAKAPDKGPHGDAAARMTGEDELLDGEGLPRRAVAAGERLALAVEENGETLEDLGE